jgi:hypothetical protein
VFVKVDTTGVHPLAPLSTSSVQVVVPSAVTEKSSANQPVSSNPASVAYRRRSWMLCPANPVRLT